MINKIHDTDTHFIIDGSTRLVKNETETKSMLVQYDHNSERFTFRVPRYCDSHDLSECNCVRVHYINIDKSKRTENHGIDEIVDLAVCPEDSEYVQCSWLITKNATQLAGSLHFVIQFAEKDGEITKYSWNTAKYTGITIQDGINFDEETVSENNDLLAQWENRLKASQIVTLEQTLTSDEPEGENVWTATFGDGSTSELKVKNGARGPAGHVGSIETISGDVLNFFVGTLAEYEALSDIEKANLCAFITNDSTKDDLIASITALEKKVLFEKITADMPNTLNDETYCVTGRWYFHHRASDATNAWQDVPIGCTNGWLETFQSPTTSTICDQIFHRAGSENNYFEIYTRTRDSSGNWSEWRRLALTDEPELNIKSAENVWGTISFKNLTDNLKGAIQLDEKHQLRFGEVFKYPEGETPTYGEVYTLPVPREVTKDNLPSKWENYNILTSKNPVSIAQGGTGATTAVDARKNLGAVSESDLTNGTITVKKADYATCDKNGTNFIGGYAKKTELEYGEITVMKAKKDGDGNVFADTYLKKPTSGTIIPDADGDAYAPFTGDRIYFLTVWFGDTQNYKYSCVLNTFGDSAYGGGRLTPISSLFFHDNYGHYFKLIGDYLKLYKVASSGATEVGFLKAEYRCIDVREAD